MIPKLLAAFKMTLGYGRDIIMTFGMAYLIAGQMQTQLQSYDLHIPICDLMICGVLGTWLIGFIGVRSGMYGAEQGWTWEKNPEWRKRHDR